MKTTPQLTVTQFIRGKRSRVFEAWLKPELVMQWFSPEALTRLSFRTDAKVGGSYVHVMRSPDGTEYTTVGEYLEIVEHEKIVFTWGKEGSADSVVTVLLEDESDGTLVTLTHAKLPEDLVSGHVAGWESALRNLEKFFLRG
ncbi:MAG: SRPBCC family protein [Bdellovibrionota bacterium]